MAFVSGRRINQVRVAVDETRHHHAAGGVDLFGAARFGQVLQAAARSDLLQNAVADQNSAVRDNAKFLEGRTAAWSFGAAQGKQLARAPD